MMKLPWNYLECYETTYKDDHNHGQDQVWLSENGTPILSRTTVLFTDGVQSDSKNGDALGHMLPLPEIYLYTVTSKAGVKTRWVRYIAIHDCLHSSFRGGRLERVGCECYGEVVVEIRLGNGMVRYRVRTDTK